MTKLRRTGELEALIATVGDVADRVGRLPESRLVHRAADGLALAQQLADAAMGIEARTATRAPEAREVPTLSVFAVGDQIAVTGQDLRAAAHGLERHILVWQDGAQRPLADVLAGLQARADALRATL